MHQISIGHVLRHVTGPGVRSVQSLPHVEGHLLVVRLPYTGKPLGRCLEVFAGHHDRQVDLGGVTNLTQHLAVAPKVPQGQVPARRHVPLRHLLIFSEVVQLTLRAEMLLKHVGEVLP